MIAKNSELIRIETENHFSEEKIGRNEPCLCGSGKKYKKCCMAKYEAAAHVMQGIKNPKSVDYTLKGAVFTEESVLEYKGPEGEITNEKDKSILNEIKKIMEIENFYLHC